MRGKGRKVEEREGKNRSKGKENKGREKRENNKKTKEKKGQAERRKGGRKGRGGVWLLVSGLIDHCGIGAVTPSEADEP